MRRAAITVSLSLLMLGTAAGLAPAQTGYPGYYPGMGYNPGYYSLPNYYTNPTYSRGLYFPGVGNSPAFSPYTYGYYGVEPGAGLYGYGYNSGLLGIYATEPTARLYTFRRDVTYNRTGGGTVEPLASTSSLAANVFAVNPIADSSSRGGVVSASFEGDDPREKRSVVFTIKVPEGAEVWFEDYQTSQKGTVRRFETPPLESGKNYKYRVRASWMEGGKKVDRPQVLKVKAGDKLNIDFTRPEEEKQPPPKSDKPKEEKKPADTDK